MNLAYYQRHKEKILARHKKWRQDNPDYYKNRKERTNQLQK